MAPVVVSDGAPMKVTHPVFSNGEESMTWEAAWCEYCVHDHTMSHDPNLSEDGCEVIVWLLVRGEGMPDPECLVDGRGAGPNRMICARFEPCTEGDCIGDPEAEVRAERVAEVTAYWRARALDPEDGKR